MSDQQSLPYTAKSLLGKSINETFIPFLKGFSDIVWSFRVYYTVWFFPYINTNGLATTTFTTYSYHFRLGEIENGGTPVFQGSHNSNTLWQRDGGICQ